MTLETADVGKEYIISRIDTDDDELNAFLFSLGCYTGEAVTVVSRRGGGCVTSVKDGRYNIDIALAAAVTGFIAKENVVGTLAVCFVGLENLIDTDELALLEGAGAQAAGIIAITKVAALAYLVFNLFTPPCFAAIGAMNSEMKSAKWLMGGIGLQLGVGYTVGYLVYTVGTLITAPQTLNVTAALAGLAAVLVFAAVLAALIVRAGRKVRSDYSLAGRNINTKETAVVR